MVSSRVPSVNSSLVVEDNTALATAAEKAKELGVPVIALFVISPGDYKIHDRGPNRIDFLLRTLRWLKVSLLHVSWRDKLTS